MIQTDLDRAVAQATGENVCFIRQRGFTLADPIVVQYDPEPCEVDVEAKILDWDEYDLQRNVPLIPQRSSRLPIL